MAITVHRSKTGTILLVGILALVACRKEHPSTSTSQLCIRDPERISVERSKLLPGLAERAVDSRQIEGGILLLFDNTAEMVTYVTDFIQKEKACCNLLHFKLDTAVQGHVALEVLGDMDSISELKSYLKKPLSEH